MNLIERSEHYMYNLIYCLEDERSMYLIERLN